MIRIAKGAGWPILTPRETPAFDHVADAYPMPSVALGLPAVSDGLYHGYERVDVVEPELYQKYDVKRGLRNADGSGVLVGLTTISNVHGYIRTDHGVVPDDGAVDLFAVAESFSPLEVHGAVGSVSEGEQHFTLKLVRPAQFDIGPVIRDSRTGFHHEKRFFPHVFLYTLSALRFRPI